LILVQEGFIGYDHLADRSNLHRWDLLESAGPSLTDTNFRRSSDADDLIDLPTSAPLVILL